MIIRFDIEVDGLRKPQHILMHQIPEYPAPPKYYIATYGNADNLDIKTFANTSFDKLLEPRESFALYLKRFGE